MARPFLQQKFACEHCSAETWRKPSQISHGAEGPLAGLMFCSRYCQKAHFRPQIQCSWPGCNEVRLIEARNYRVKQASGWLCDHHTARMERMTGSRKMTARKLEFLRGGTLDHNRLTWSFVKFVVYEQADGMCCGCSKPLDFALRPVEFHCDHIVPLWQRGKTTRANLQLLCIPCHQTKSSAEQKLVNQTRWKKRTGANFQRMTHAEKDSLIARLLTEARAIHRSTAMSEPRLFGSIDEFRQALKATQDGTGEPIGADAAVRASFDTEVKAGESDRSLTFTISTASVDRMGDSISVEGWQLEEYRKNPVVLADHDSSVWSVMGKSKNIWIEAGKLKSTMEFVPRENPLTGRVAEGVLQMYRNGFLSATSVGFLPLKYAFTTDPQRKYGIDFQSQTLLEFSLVAVPANPEALIEGKRAGVDVDAMLDHYADTLKRVGDDARILKLAEDVLGGAGKDAEALAWAERILAASGKLSVIESGRLAAVKSLAEEFRSDAKKAANAKGASGIYRRCANRIEKAIAGEEETARQAAPEATEAEQQQPVQDNNIVPGFAEIAARRLKTVRNKTV